MKGKSDAPSSTLHVKLRDLKKFSTPSPNTYNPQSAEKETRKSAASYSFGMKTSASVSSKTSPAPNAYAVPAVKESPAYSLAARAKEQKVCLVPGPGTYEVSDGEGIGGRGSLTETVVIISPVTSTS